MSSPQNAVVPSGYPSSNPLNFNNSSGTLLRVLQEPMAAAIGTTTAPQYYGGLSVLDIIASSTDSVARDFILWEATIVTTQETTATGAITTTTTTVVRANGSWLTDGWQIGDSVSIFPTNNAAPAAGAEGLLGAVSAVSATTLTFTAIGTAWAAGTASAGSRVCKMHQKFRKTVPINAGNSASIANVNFLNDPNDASLLRTELKLGPTEMLVLQPVAALSALPATISFKTQLARY